MGDDTTPRHDTSTITGGAVRHGRLRRRSPLAVGAQVVAAVAAVALVSSGSVAAIASWQVLSHAAPTVSLAMPGAKVAKAAPALTAQSGEVNMLLVATDTRDGQGTGFDDPANRKASSGVGNNDTNLLVHISADHTNMAVVSFPRDLVVAIPACTNDSGSVTPAASAAMLNTALSRGGERHGLACVASTISALTGLQIPYAGKITFDGVVQMADAVGGVPVCLATPIRDTDVTPALDLQAGPQQLSGAEAAAFLRSRHGVGDGSDLGRISNQQTFMSALARQTVSAGTLTNPAKVLRLADTAFRNMTLSDTLSDPGTLARIALAVNSVGLSNMVFVQYPVIDDPDAPGRVLVAEAAATQLNGVLEANQPIVLGADSLGRSAVRDPSAAASPDGAARTPGAGTPAAGSPAAGSPAAGSAAAGSAAAGSAAAGAGTSGSTGAGTSAGGASAGGTSGTASGTSGGAPAAGSGAGAGPTAAATTPAALPDNVTGQTADTVTCAARD